jgi:hypothetical protein
MNHGHGPAGPLIGEESFAKLSGRAIQVAGGDESLWYGYGLFYRQVRGHHYLGHPGGMVGYLAGMLADMETGLGVTVLVNGPGAPNAIARAVLDFLRAAAEGQPAALPDREPTMSTASLAGTYLPERETDTPIDVELAAGQLVVRTAHGAFPLATIGDGRFATAGDPWAGFHFAFEREGDRCMSITHGPHRWLAADQPRPAPTELPPEWRPLPGHYRSHNPWLTGFRVFERSGRLWLSLAEEPDGLELEQPLVPVGPNRFRAGDDPRIPEWISFDTIVDGVALHATLASGDYYRVEAS